MAFRALFLGGHRMKGSEDYSSLVLIRLASCPILSTAATSAGVGENV